MESTYKLARVRYERKAACLLCLVLSRLVISCHLVVSCRRTLSFVPGERQARRIQCAFSCERVVTKGEEGVRLIEDVPKKKKEAD